MKTSKRDWLIIGGLLLLALVPSAAGAFRLTQLAGKAETAENARYLASPAPVVLHVLSAALFSCLGAFQFAPGFRAAWPRWHRRLGAVLIVAGALAALTGLWMTVYYPWANFDGIGVYYVRLTAGTLMLSFILLSVNSIRTRDFTRHGHWMIRAYALGMGAGTQVLTHLPWVFFPSLQGELSRLIFMTAGWALNVIFAEWVIRRPST
ncbi:MAG TPA: DUF2306 domain-containing protein [Bdellovibrionales bacterium]|nr:DUF2306 domain-containing protein [Bdellovibrionales bacterium]